MGYLKAFFIAFVLLTLCYSNSLQQLSKVRIKNSHSEPGFCSQENDNVRRELMQEIEQILVEQNFITTEPSSSFTTTEEHTTVATTEEVTTTVPEPPCGEPEWRQVAFINMTNTSYSCPPGLNLTSYSKRTCGRVDSRGAHSTIFSIGGSEYRRVCGRIRGYQVGFATAFFGYLRYSYTIEDLYATGVSLTHGARGNRQHIWTFAAGVTEDDHHFLTYLCPCDTTSNTTVSPPFVGSDYFCESGISTRYLPSHDGVPFLDDPLWDGQNCTSTSTCCQFNNPPWFTKTLPNPTTDDIELRLIASSIVGVGDIALELVELYVQ